MSIDKPQFIQNGLKNVISSFQETRRGKYLIKLSVIGTPTSKKIKTILNVASVCVIIQNEKTDETHVRFFSHEDKAIQFIDDLVEERIIENVFQKLGVDI